MNYHLIFDPKGKLVGFTTKEEYAKGLIKQRKKFQELYTQKIREKSINEQMKKDLSLSELEVFSYGGAYLFEHEEDEIHTQTYEIFEKTFKVLDGFFQDVLKFKFNEDEAPVMGEFIISLEQAMEQLLESNERFGDPEGFQIFNIKKVALELLKKKYKRRG
jgi:hypothetical protein